MPTESRGTCSSGSHFRSAHVESECWPTRRRWQSAIQLEPALAMPSPMTHSASTPTLGPFLASPKVGASRMTWGGGGRGAYVATDILAESVFDCDVICNAFEMRL